MKFWLLVVALIPLAWPLCADAGPRGTTVEEAIEVLEDLAAAPEKRIPPALLRDASAVIIAPDVMKAGFIVGGRHGHGVLLVRNKAGGWSDPVFLTITGGSVGWQAGVQATDLFLIIRNERSLERILRGGGKLTLGAEASVAAGPVGREASAATDLQLKAEILSYSRSRGLFGGIALDGDAIMVDHIMNDRFYGERRVRVSDIVAGKARPPKQAETLKMQLGMWSGDTTTTKQPPPVAVEPPRK